MTHRQRTFQFQLGRGPRRGGLPGVLVLVVGGVVLVGVVALVFFVGAIVAVTALVASAAAALYFGARRLLTGKGAFTPPARVGQAQVESWPFTASAPSASSPSSVPSVQVREIEVEVLPGSQR